MMNTEPDYEAALGLIKHLSSDELRDIMNNENKLQELIRDLPQIKNLESEKEILLAANKSLAEYNISFEPKLTEGKQELISKFEESASLQEQIQIIKTQIDKSSTKQTPEAIQNIIKIAAQELEEETEKLVKSFLNNGPSVEDFLEEFVCKRAKAHLRKVKAEKAEDLISRNKNNNQNSLFQPPVVTTPWNTPYPPHLPNMPMPAYPLI